MAEILEGCKIWGNVECFELRMIGLKDNWEMIWIIEIEWLRHEWLRLEWLGLEWLTLEWLRLNDWEWMFWIEWQFLSFSTETEVMR